jgi:dihydroorotate dehydrogenase electron transfer subunit
MVKSIETAKVISNVNITANIYDMVLECPEIASQAKAGQFVEVYTGSAEYLLARPISICEIKENGLRLVFQAVGKGTAIFSSLKAGDEVRVLGPCGNGYDLKAGKSALLVGGGIGVPPLLEAVKQLGGGTVVLASRNSELSILKEDFEKVGATVYIATDDGSEGFKGNAVQLLREKALTADAIYSCGPKIMLKFLTEYAVEIGAECQVSMEERMACGIGACVGCVVKIKSGDDECEWEHKKVCKDGPVFEGREVIW